VRIYALHDASTVARIAGADPPQCESLALATDDPSDVLFSFVGGNPLAPDWLAELDLPGERIASWSGTLAHDSVENDDLFAAHPHNWMGPGAEALDTFLDGVIDPLANAGRTLCLLPHARHVLSDVQGSINLIRKRADQPIEVALAPIALLTPSMLDALADHLERAFDTLAEHAPFLLLTDAVIDQTSEHLRTVPLGAGIIERETLLAAIERHWPPEKPLVIMANDLADQVAWLAGS
jgi:hypothetical protein